MVHIIQLKFSIELFFSISEIAAVKRGVSKNCDDVACLSRLFVDF